MSVNAKTAAARAFVRSFNILLKFAKLYGYDHARTTAQFEIVRNELRQAFGQVSAGLLLSAAGNQLLVDGVAIETTAAERGLAEKLTLHEISSIHFLPGVTADDISKLIRAFPSGQKKDPQFASQLRNMFEGSTGIRVNTVCYVTADSAAVEKSLMQQLASETMGAAGADMRELLNDPSKLLQLIAAAEGSRGGPGGGVGGGGSGSGSGSGSGTGYGSGSGFGVGSGSGGEGSQGIGFGAGHGGGGVGTGEGTGGSGEGMGSGPGLGGASHVYGNGSGPGIGDGSGGTGHGFGSSGVGPGSSSGGGSGLGGFGQGSGGDGKGSGVPVGGGSGSASGEGSSAVGGYGADGGSGQGGSGAPFGQGLAGSPSGGGSAVSSGASSGGKAGDPSSGVAGGSGGSIGTGQGNGSGGPTGPGSASGGWGGSTSGAEVGGGASGGGIGGGGGFGPGTGGVASGTGGVGFGGGAGTGIGSGPGGAGGSGPGSGGVSDLAQLMEAVLAAKPGAQASAVQGIATESQSPGRWQISSSQMRTGPQIGSVLNIDFEEPKRWGVSVGPLAPAEDDFKDVLGVLRQIASTIKQSSDSLSASAFQQRLSSVPVRVQRSLADALRTLAAHVAQSAGEIPSQEMLVKLAEHMAIRFALERYERGEVRVNAIRKIFEHMSQEIEQLRSAAVEPGAAPSAEKPSDVPLSERLTAQFWTQSPRNSLKEVLLSPEAWHVPGRAVRQCVDELIGAGEDETAARVLENYSFCISAHEFEARRYTAMGMTEIADLVAATSEELMIASLNKIAAQLRAETKSNLLTLMSAAFVRLCQEALRRRMLRSMCEAVRCVKDLEGEKKEVAADLRSRLDYEERLPELLEDALQAREASDELKTLLRAMPAAAIAGVTERFGHCGFREDCDFLLKVARDLGEESLKCLRDTFVKEPGSRAAETLGVLSNLDPGLLEEHLPQRIRSWQPAVQDRSVRYLAGGGAPLRGQLLMAAWPHLDPLIRAMALDEIGMSEDEECADALIRLAAGTLPEGSTPYHRLKAVEALGRLRCSAAAPVLHEIAESKQFLRWVHPSELRIAAIQALKTFEPGWYAGFLNASGFNARELAFEPLPPDLASTCIRQRRYERIKLARSVAAMTTNLRENCRLSIENLSLGGGTAVAEQHLAPGALISLKIHSGLRAFKALAYVRTARNRTVAFEIAEMDLEDRAKLRKLLIEFATNSAEGSVGNRSRMRLRALRQRH